MQPGQRFAPNARLENDVRHMLNSLNGPTPGKFVQTPKVENGSLLTYPCKNSTDETLPADCAVEIDTSTQPGVIVISEKAYDFRYPWGILMQPLAPRETGRVAVSGIIGIQNQVGLLEHSFAVPDRNNPGNLISSNDCGAPVLFKDSKTYINLMGYTGYYDTTSPFHAYYEKTGLLNAMAVHITGSHYRRTAVQKWLIFVCIFCLL